MRNLVEHILNREYDAANQIFESEIETVTEIKLNEAKKMVAARMAEQVPAFMGAAGGNAVKLRRGVLEEDDLDEMDLSREKPDHSSIEDRRKGQIVQNAGKTSLPGTQNTNDEGKGDLKMTTIKKTMNEDEEELDEARIKILKARVRGGKVQRRRKVSNVEGHKMVDGKLKRMSPAERRRRKLGQKRGKLKRRSKMRLALMKRKRSLRKRASIGL
jgi:hypothetical protein